MTNAIEPPLEYRIGSNTKLVRASTDVYDEDPRGIVWLFEPPNPRARYAMGIDPTQGRTGWTRYNRTDDDAETDNGAIVVLRIGQGEPDTPEFKPDVQVAEYAAPIDPFDLAKVGNALGRLYGGSNEDGQALCIIEVYPGPGGPTQRTMMEQYGYTNMYRWQYLDTGMTSERSRFDFGWYSNTQSMKHLWTKGLRYIHRKQLVFKSPHLVEEFADCEMDLVKMRGESAHGHDDLVMACLLAIWAAHNWSLTIEPRVSHVNTGPVVEWQASDISSSRLVDAWEEKWEEICAEIEQSSA